MAIARKNSIKKNKKPGRKTRVVIRRGGSRKMNLKGGSGVNPEDEAMEIEEKTQEEAAEALLALAQQHPDDIIHPGDEGEAMEVQGEGGGVAHSSDEDLEQQLRNFLATGVESGQIDPPSDGGDPATMHINHVARTIAKRIRERKITDDKLLELVNIDNAELYNFYLTKLGLMHQLPGPPDADKSDDNESLLAPVVKALSNMASGVVVVCERVKAAADRGVRGVGACAVSVFHKMREAGLAAFNSFTAVQVVELLTHFGLSLSLIYFIITTIIPLLMTGGMSLAGALVYIIQLFTTPIVGGAVAAVGAAVNNPNTAFVTLIVLKAALDERGSTFKILATAKKRSASKSLEAVKKEILRYLNETYNEANKLRLQREDRDNILGVVADGVQTTHGGPIALDFSSLTPKAADILEAAIQGIPINASYEEAADHVIQSVNTATVSENASSASIALHYLINSSSYMTARYNTIVHNFAVLAVDAGSVLYRVGAERKARQIQLSRAKAQAAKAGLQKLKGRYIKYDLMLKHGIDSKKILDKKHPSEVKKALKALLETAKVLNEETFRIYVRDHLSPRNFQTTLKRLKNYTSADYETHKLTYITPQGLSGGARKVRGTRKNLRIKSRNSNKNKNKKRVSKKLKSRK